MIGISEADDTAESGIEDAWIEAALGLASEVAHRAVTAGVEPFAIELAAFIEGMESGKPDHRKTEVARRRGDDLVQLGHGH